MRRMSNGEVGGDLEHVLFMPMEPLPNLYHLNFSQSKNQIKRVIIVIRCPVFDISCLYSALLSLLVFCAVLLIKEHYITIVTVANV